jgi:hypothetical protein
MLNTLYLFCLQHSCTTKRGEKPEKISDVLLDLGSESGCPVAEVSSIARSRQLQRSRRSSGGSLGEVLLTILIPDILCFDAHFHLCFWLFKII